jgi:hypothetical protein
MVKPRPKCSHPGCTAAGFAFMLKAPGKWLCMAHLHQQINGSSGRGTDTGRRGLSRRALLERLLGKERQVRRDS